MAQLQVPWERYEKLREVAAGLDGGATLSAALGELLRAYAALGLVSHDLPGIRINRLPDGIALRFDDAVPLPLYWSGAAAFFDALRDAVIGASQGPVTDAAHGFSIAARGNGFRVQLHGENGPVKTFSRDVLADLAELIRKTLPEDMPQAA